jgi:tRNA pseudouridine32 synthase/23S rRNA pseudouridine746 synthase
MPATVLYEDGRLIAVEKPAGVPVIPERHGTVSLRAELEAELGRKLYVVHRLDRETSGVLVFAKDAAAHSYLNARFEAREVSKRYIAVALGRIHGDTGVIDAPIRQFGSGRMGVDRETGKPCLTRYELRSAASDRDAPLTVLDVFPVTGRRHQIRVHLYSIGHPVAGDRLYGDRSLQERFPRLLLHAAEIAFTGPDGVPVRVCSPVPEEFVRYIG